MNITITQIVNGWIVSVQTPKGGFAKHCKDYDTVLAELSALQSTPDNLIKLEKE